MARPDLEELDRLIAEQEASVKRAFQNFVRTVGRDGPVLSAIIAKLENRDVDGALRIVNSYVAVMGNVLPAVSHAVGAATAAELARLVPNVSVGISFDPSFPRAAEIIRANRLQFVNGFTAQQRAATIQALGRAYQAGKGTTATARAFRDSIGLTPSQETAVDNYRKLLEKGSRDALDRALRDRRFDRAVVNAIENEKPLTAAQIDRMVDRYRSNFVAMRAETIARTEGVRATSQAREESLDQMIAQTGISVASVIRIWNSLHDQRVRHWHETMDKQERPRNEPFQDGLGNQLMYPGDPSAPAETVINCRCGTTFRIDA